MERFDADDFIWSIKKENSGHVTHLFFAHRKSLNNLAAYPEVLVMDCTYKTNWFDLPLFSIVGMTASNSTFFVAFAFLKQEAEADYAWSLENLQEAVGS